MKMEGSAGWYLMIQAEYSVDNNDDDTVDACDGLNITITDSKGNDMNSTLSDTYETSTVDSMIT